MTKSKAPSKSPDLEERSERLVVSPQEVAGRLKSTAGDSDIMLIWNVSDQGLCVWTAAKLVRGERVIVEMVRPWQLTIRSEVRWCRSVPDRSGYLVGLLALDHLGDLQRLHAALGGKAARAV